MLKLRTKAFTANSEVNYYGQDSWLELTLSLRLIRLTSLTKDGNQ